jgi:hypothetical protein
MDTIWTPIPGTEKKNRQTCTKTTLSGKRSDHRNSILKDWATRLENTIEPQVPSDYTSPFDPKECMFCLKQLSKTKSKNIDEFRPISQRGRMNVINCNPCCGGCNPSKNDLCGNKLVNWIKNVEIDNNKRTPVPPERAKMIIEWFEKYEKYMIIDVNTCDALHNKTYYELEKDLDIRLDAFYKEMM